MTTIHFNQFIMTTNFNDNYGNKLRRNPIRNQVKGEERLNFIGIFYSLFWRRKERKIVKIEIYCCFIWWKHITHQFSLFYLFIYLFCSQLSYIANWDLDLIQRHWLNEKPLRNEVISFFPSYYFYSISILHIS